MNPNTQFDLTQFDLTKYCANEQFKFMVTPLYWEDRIYRGIKMSVGVSPIGIMKDVTVPLWRSIIRMFLLSY